MWTQPLTMVCWSSHYIAFTHILTGIINQGKWKENHYVDLNIICGWHIGVDPNIQITLEMIKDEQLSIIADPYSKHLIDFIFLVAEEKIYNWLSPPKESMNYNAAYAILKSQPDACQWFLNGNTFSEWLKQPGFLWIKGKCKFSNKFV